MSVFSSHDARLAERNCLKRDWLSLRKGVSHAASAEDYTVVVFRSE